MSPTLSVVVTAFNAPELLEACLASLVPQARQIQAEVILVGDWGASSAPPLHLQQRYPDVTWISAPGGSTVPQMRGLGLAHSQAEIVALVEDDCVVAETWCAAIVKAHCETYAAIGGAVEPGPYRHGLDWAVYLCEYSRFMLPLPAEEWPKLALNNVSYKRQALAGRLANIDQGNGTMGAYPLYDVFVHERMRLAGDSLKADPAIIVQNFNTWTPANVTSVPYHHGRGFAAMRVAGLPWWRRWLYAGMAVFLPPLQIWRIAGQVLARRRFILQMGLAMPWLILYAFCWSLGELAGYLRGPGDSLQRWGKLNGPSR